MNPLIKEYLSSKYGPNYEKEQEAAFESAKSRANLGNLFGDLGDAIAGRQIGSTDAYFQNALAEAEKNTVGKAKTAKKEFLEDYTLEKEFKKSQQDEAVAARENDPNSEDSKLAQNLAIKMGLPPEQAQAMTAARFKTLSPVLQKTYEIEQKKMENALKRQENAIKQAQAAETKAQKNKDIELLPEEDKIVVKDLAASNAKKISIKNQIDAVVNAAPNMTDAEKLQQSRQLIKTLNSSQGQDAVGAEEAKRLAAKLEFAMGGLTSGNYGQFGRDVDGFLKDAAITSKSLADSITENNKIIKNAYGRVGVEKNPSQIYEEKAQVKEPDVEAYAKKYGISYEQAAQIKKQRTQKQAAK